MLVIYFPSRSGQISLFQLRTVFEHFCPVALKLSFMQAGPGMQVFHAAV
jgi:hypothetical protein